jgi:hypothetical protein
MGRFGLFASLPLSYQEEKDLFSAGSVMQINSLFGWLVANGWCWFVVREEYCWLVASGWFLLREKYCWLVADKPSEQADTISECVGHKINEWGVSWTNSCFHNVPETKKTFKNIYTPSGLVNEVV